MANVTVNDIYNLLKDFSRNDNLDSTKAIRTINSACDFVFTLLGLPSQEREYTFQFTQDQPTYKLPDDFLEAISLRFEDDTYNKDGRWTMRPVEYLYERVERVGVDTRLFGVDYASGSPRLWVLGRNHIGVLQIDSFDYNNSLNWTASNDAENISDDTNTYKEGNGSMAFDIDVSSGLNRATLTRTNISLDLKQYQDVGHFKIYVYLPNVTGLTSISFNWGNDESNYYKQTVTAQEDGTAFEVGWNNLDFAWEDSIQVGSPDISDINRIWFDIDYEEGYTGGFNYRFDYLRIVVPDTMILTYYTKYKGQDAAGNNLENFSNLTDVLFLGNVDTGLKNLIALYGAIMLKPQLLQENNWVADQFNLYLSVYQKRYPRKRANNLLTIPSIAKTD